MLQQYASGVLGFWHTQAWISGFEQPFVGLCATQQSPTPLQVPPTQGLPSQHSPLAAQAAPSGLHWPETLQTPFVQTFDPQQSALTAHAWLRSLHEEQEPWSHVSPMQQSALVEQKEPSWLQGSWQVELMHSWLSQQSPAKSQLAPAGLQQKPPVQVPPPQHCADVSHAPPLGVHSPQKPPWQRPSQQSSLVVQRFPGVLQETHWFM